MSEEVELSDTLSIEFTLRSGETVSVRDTLEEPPTEASIRRYAERLVGEMGTDAVRVFAYWWGGDFYVDGVCLSEVAALSVSPVAPEDEALDEWHEDE